MLKYEHPLANQGMIQQLFFVPREPRLQMFSETSTAVACSPRRRRKAFAARRQSQEEWSGIGSIRSTRTQSMCAELGCRWPETTKSRIGSAQLARREAEHQSAIADLQCQLASAQIAAERMKADRTVTVSGPTANRDLQDPGSQGCFTIKFY